MVNGFATMTGEHEFNVMDARNLKEGPVSRKLARRILVGAAVFLPVLCLALAAQEERLPPKKLDTAGARVVFDSTRFQSQITSPQGLGPLAGELSLYGQELQAMGFAAKSDEAKTFLIGSFYSELVAHVRSGKSDLALDRLRAIEKEFILMGVPVSAYNFISRLENAIATGRYDAPVLLEILGLFQPVYEDHLQAKGQDHVILFQAGSWLMDMGLAAAARDSSLLRQPDVLKYFAAEMERMDAPKGVRDALAEISKISEKAEISDREADQVLRLIKRIQNVLG